MAGLNESLLGSDRRVDLIVLRSELWFNGKHFFVCEPYEIDHRIIVPFQQLFAVRQTGDVVGFRQLLRTMSLEALELKITVNDPVDTGTVNASFTCNLARRSVYFGLVLLTQYNVSMFSSVCTERGLRMPGCLLTVSILWIFFRR